MQTYDDPGGFSVIIIRDCQYIRARGHAGDILVARTGGIGRIQARARNAANRRPLANIKFDDIKAIASDGLHLN